MRIASARCEWHSRYQRPKRTTRLLTGYQIFSDGNLGVTFQILPADPNRKSLSVQVASSNPNGYVLLADEAAKLAYATTSGQAQRVYAGTDAKAVDGHTGPVYVQAGTTVADTNVGWQTLMPRQIFNGNANIFGPSLKVTDISGIRLLLRVYSVSGTTPNIIGSVYSADNLGQFSSGSTVVNTAARTTAGATMAAAAVTAVDTIVGFMTLTGGSADQSIDAELLAYISKTGSEADVAAPVVVSWAAVTE